MGENLTPAETTAKLRLHSVCLEWDRSFPPWATLKVRKGVQWDCEVIPGLGGSMEGGTEVGVGEQKTCGGGSGCVAKVKEMKGK